MTILMIGFVVVVAVVLVPSRWLALRPRELREYLPGREELEIEAAHEAFNAPEGISVEALERRVERAMRRGD